MPRYDWECLTCKGARPSRRTVVEVIRRMDDSGEGPELPCRTCKGTGFKRIFTVAVMYVPGGLSERSPFPLKVPKLHKQVLFDPVTGDPVRNAQGIPIVTYTDVVFTSAAQQREYLDKHNMDLMMDGEADSTKNEDSTHSFFDQIDSGAPSEDAIQMARDIFYTEDPLSLTDTITPIELHDPVVDPMSIPATL